MAERETPATDRVRVEVWSRSIWQVVGAVLITVTLIWLVFQARSLVGMLVVSFFFSLALQPAVNSLHRRYGWRRGAAVGVIYWLAPCW